MNVYIKYSLITLAVFISLVIGCANNYIPTQYHRSDITNSEAGFQWTKSENFTSVSYTPSDNLTGTSYITRYSDNNTSEYKWSK
jgi:hypothetical protein